VPSPAHLDPVRQLRSWQRFHLRITALFATAVFSVITVAAGLSYVLALRAVRQGLADQMQTLSVAYAQGIDVDELRAMEGDPNHPLRAELTHWFSQVHDPRIATIYVLAYDPDPARLRFLLDWTRDGDSARPGERYDASALVEMQEGFRRTTYEREMYEDRWGLAFSTYSPILNQDGSPYALVGMDIQASDVHALQRQVLWLTLLAWSVGALTVALASWVVGRNVRQPLNQVIEATARIAEGAFDIRLQSDRNDEFGLMADHFDRMAEGLEEREIIRETFGRYVAPEVARTLLADGAHLGGAQIEVTVLFTDLRSYSTITEALDPTQTVELSNAYLGRMQQAIDAEGGTVIEFLGDAILAVFGAPTFQEDHPARAVRCALAMREGLIALNAEAEASGLAQLWKQAGVDGLAHRVGVHTGMAVAGNIGSATRMKYAIVGDTVNVAARLEQLNKSFGTDLLLSEATLSRLPEGMVDATPRGDTPVKGRAEPVKIYSL
jgi:adenylate cyclase